MFDGAYGKVLRRVARAIARQGGIVEKYFDTWAGIITATQNNVSFGAKRIAYIDLFAGPGRYNDGATSTPLRVLEKAIANATYAERLVTIFMRRAHWHRFQILTKRAERLIRDGASIGWPANVWMGVSVESAKYLPRVDALRRVAAAVRFLSLEPLLGRLPSLDLTGIHWVIVGGESGPRARPMNEAWVTEIRDRCREEGVPFFFKQWGGVNKKRTGRVLEGRTWSELPATAQVASRRNSVSLPVVSS